MKSSFRKLLLSLLACSAIGKHTEADNDNRRGVGNLRGPDGSKLTHLKNDVDNLVIATLGEHYNKLRITAPQLGKIDMPSIGEIASGIGGLGPSPGGIPPITDVNLPPAATGPQPSAVPDTLPSDVTDPLPKGIPPPPEMTTRK